MERINCFIISKKKNIEVKGIYDTKTNKLCFLKGSIISEANPNSLDELQIKKLDRLKNDGVIKNNVFTVNTGFDFNRYTFTSIAYGTSGNAQKSIMKEDGENLFLHEILDDDGTSFQDRVEKALLKNLNQSGSEKPLKVINAKKGIVIDKNPEYSRIAIEKMSYFCLADKEHHSFTSSRTNRQYVEGHHLIPCTVTNSERFANKGNIDCVENIVALCPNCHRKIHFAIERERLELAEKLYDLHYPTTLSKIFKIAKADFLKLYGRED